MEKKLIWTLPTRIMHAFFVVLFTAAWLTSDNDMTIKIHIIVGIVLGWLVLYRIILGFVGSDYSKFSNFPFGFTAVKNYFLTLFKPHDYGGHNPASAWSAILMLLGIGATVISGVLTYMHSSHFMKEVHEFFTYATTAVVAAHIGGALLSAKINGLNAVTCMANGVKETAKNATNQSSFQKTFSWIGVTLSFGAAFGGWLFIGAYENKVIKEAAAKLPKEYVKECASCHSLYPSAYLNAESWTKVFDGLDKHFGTDASLDEGLTQTLKEYVVANAGPDNNSKFSRKSSAEDGIEISKTKAWKKKHEDIPKEVFLQKKTRPSNCVACHKDANSGIIRAANISVEDKK
jgi:cytochrome b